MVHIDRSKITQVFLGILVVVAVGVVLKYAASVILPLVIAWLFSYLLGPAVNYMTQRKVPTTLAVVIILIFLLGIFYLSGTFLYARISALAAAYPRYHARMTELIATVTAQLNLGFDPFAGINWGQSVGRFLMTLSGSVFAFASKLVLVVVFLFFHSAWQTFF